MSAGGWHGLFPPPDVAPALRLHMLFELPTRLVREFGAALNAEDAAAALERLTFQRDRLDETLATLVAGAVGTRTEARGTVTLETITITRDARSTEHATLQPLGELERARASVVRIERGIYPSIPTSAGRARLLAMASRAAADVVIVHVPVIDEGTHPGRAFVDAPRALLRRLGRPTAEPGDRFPDGGYTHCFFDEEALAREFAQAGLVIARRHRFTFALVRQTQASQAAAEFPPNSDDAPVFVEFSRVLRTVTAVERQRLGESPERVIDAMRRRGRVQKKRGLIGRARLRRAIGWVDALMPTGANCYRRTLLELALDGGAAREAVVFGLDVGTTGHVAFADREERSFDVTFEVLPPA